MPEVIVAVDLGAGSLRAGAVRPDGRLLAHAAVPLTALSPAPGWHEIDPQHWWSALCEATGQVVARLTPRSRVIALVVGGLTRAQVLVDRAGIAIGRAPLFRDRRAAEEAAIVARHWPHLDPADAITAFHPVARLAWFARHRQDLFDRTHAVMEPRDYLGFLLTGRSAVDSVTGSRLDALGAPDTALPTTLRRCLDLLDGPRIAPWAQLGEVAASAPPFAALRGVPVFAGSMDAWCSAAGAGAVRPGQAYDIAGTSEVVGLIGTARLAVAGLVAMRWSEDAWQIGGPTQAGADCAAWCHALFRVPGRLDQAVTRAGGMPTDSSRALFLPYLAGERTPVWRDDVPGIFHGLTRTQSPDDFLWSVMEGVAHSVRDILRTAVIGGAQAAGAIRLAGGGARSDAWCQLKADVLGLPVERTAHRETGLVGAAMCAAVGLGLQPTLADAARVMSPVQRTFEPAPDRADFARDRAALYQHVKRHALERVDPSPSGHGTLGCGAGAGAGGPA